MQSVVRFAIPAGAAIGIGIVTGYNLARYGFDLSLIQSRTVATGIVVMCGLAVVLQVEGEGGRRRLTVAVLCGAMLLLFAPRARRPVSPRLLRARDTDNRCTLLASDRRRPRQQRNARHPPTPARMTSSR